MHRVPRPVQPACAAANRRDPAGARSETAYSRYFVRRCRELTRVEAEICDRKPGGRYSSDCPQADSGSARQILARQLPDEVDLPDVDPVVDDPASGSNAGTPDDASVDLDASPAQCDQGLTITIESTAPNVTGMVWRFADAEEFERCDVSLEAP